MAHHPLDRDPARVINVDASAARTQIHTISPSNTTFSPRMRKRPCQCSANALPWYIRSTVSSRTRLAKKTGELKWVGVSAFYEEERRLTELIIRP